MTVRKWRLEEVVAGDVLWSDIRIGPAQLQRQADTARAAGNGQLAENFERAAELVSVDDVRLLAIYEALRPGRSSARDLELLATELERDAVPMCARLVREASTVYLRRGLLKS